MDKVIADIVPNTSVTQLHRVAMLRFQEMTNIIRGDQLSLINYAT
jgi:hypothetical protein